MSELYADIGWKSIIHDGEQLCGDHVEVVSSKHAQVIVLADGLSSGVKASILSTLTSRIISTMISQGLPLEECVAAIAAALPVDSQKGVAYSTFTILHIKDCEEADLIQFDNPPVILLRGANRYEYPRETLEIDGKTILKSTIRLKEGDVFVAMSDGCVNASAVRTYSYSWTRKDIADYMKIFAPVGYSAKTLATMLTDEIFRRYAEHPLDDATACVVCIKPRAHVNLLFGPPQDPADDQPMLKSFFGEPGKHIICGGTTAKLASAFLNKPIKALSSVTPTDIPPMSSIEGVDLVTEGVLTMTRVNEYAVDILGDNARYAEWSTGHDGACHIARLLLEEGTDIHIFLGRAVNPAYQSPDLPGQLNLKMRIVDKLASELRQMGKRVEISRY